MTVTSKAPWPSGSQDSTARESSPASPTPNGGRDAAPGDPARPLEARRHPNAAADDLPLSLQDAIFQHQMSQTHPLSVTPQTIIAAGICEGDKHAANVHHALVKAGVLESTCPHVHGPRQGFFGLVSRVNSGAGSKKDAPDPAADEEFLPVTTKITGALPKQVRVLSVNAVKLLIKMLFFWEEEVNRWRARELDEAELQKALSGYWEERRALEEKQATDAREEEEAREELERLEKMAQEVEFRIQAVRLRRRVKPSERDIKLQLPQYESR